MSVEIVKRFYDIFAITTDSSFSEGVISFFENNPFLILKDNTLIGFVFSSSPLSQEEQNKIKKRFYIDGIADLKIIQTKEQIISFFERL